MKHLILAYVANDSFPRVTEEDIKRLTHINLAFGLVKDGLLDMSGLTHMELLPKFRSWNPDLRIVLSVGGWGAGGFSEMARTAEGRRSFALSCAEAVEKYGLDGIDIDWEYPCSDQAGIGASPDDRESYTLLLKDLREQLQGKLLSVAAGAGQYFIDGTQMDQVAEIVDYVQIMTYDLRNGFMKQAGHHAALFSGRGDKSGLDTSSMVRLFHAAGVPLQKMVIGAAFYSRRWTGVRNRNSGLLQPAESIGMGGPGFEELTPEFREKGGFTEYWDEEAQASYLWNGSEFISFESPRAVELKGAYAKEQGLLGIMYWEYGCDTTGTLLSALCRGFE